MLDEGVRETMAVGRVGDDVPRSGKHRVEEINPAAAGAAIDQIGRDRVVAVGFEFLDEIDDLGIAYVRAIFFEGSPIRSVPMTFSNTFLKLKLKL
jgi:hypothetical protein